MTDELHFHHKNDFKPSAVKLNRSFPPLVGVFGKVEAEIAAAVLVHALKVDVLAVFEHDGRTMATVAEWFPSRHRWNYETISGLAARFSYWPDGQEPPERHESAQGGLCACCVLGAKDAR